MVACITKIASARTLSALSPVVTPAEWIKPRWHAPDGTLLPLPALGYPWRDISMDFVVGFPQSNGHDAIWVVVDRLTKQFHFPPCNTDIDAEGLADLFLTHASKPHRLPAISRTAGPSPCPLPSFGQQPGVGSHLLSPSTLYAVAT